VTTVTETQRLVENIVRLRRAERVRAVADDVAAVRGDLEAELGPTVSRSRAARLLGVSQTALDRWVASGDVPTVITPNGRIEVPRQFVIEMAELIDDLRRKGEDRHVLAAALRARAEEARRVRDRIEPHDRRRGRVASRRPQGHRTAERRSLAYHRVVADRLDEQLVREARQRIEALSEAGRIHPRYARRWEQLLARPIPEIAEAISSDTQGGRELRQSSPFAGVLNEQERREIIESVR
jgi:hypothetical protein